jgi:hypothetical protein
MVMTLYRDRIPNSNRYRVIELECQYCKAQSVIYDGRGITRHQAKADAYDAKCGCCHQTTRMRDERKRRVSA